MKMPKAGELWYSTSLYQNMQVTYIGMEYNGIIIRAKWHDFTWEGSFHDFLGEFKELANEQ